MMLDIHLEWVEREDSGKRLQEIVGVGRPIIISPVPILFDSANKSGMFGREYPHNYYYPERFVGVLKECVQEQNVILGQQGYTHYCRECGRQKSSVDPYHEFKCLYKRSMAVEEQRGIIFRGKEIIEDVLGVSPRVLVPPNHQFDANTCLAAKAEGFEYLATRSILRIPVYYDSLSRLIILPENKFGQEGEVIYTHYDHMYDSDAETDVGKWEGFLELVRNSSALPGLSDNGEDGIPASNWRTDLNHQFILLRKLMRDSIKRR